MVGWLVGWSVGRLVGWSVGRLVGWSVGRLVGWSVGRSVKNFLIDPSVRRSITYSLKLKISMIHKDDNKDDDDDDIKNDDGEIMIDAGHGCIVDLLGLVKSCFSSNIY